MTAFQFGNCKWQRAAVEHLRASTNIQFGSCWCPSVAARHAAVTAASKQPKTELQPHLPWNILVVLAGTPVGNQALLFAGRHLGPDSALLLEELQLDSYSLAHEVR